MFLHIDSHNGVPVYEQVVRQVKFAIADGVLPAGDLLPSVRELARELAINPNTVARAYRDLQGEGLVEHASGIGLAVKSAARRDCQTQRRRLMQERISTAIAEAFQSGLSPDEVRRMADTEIKRHDKTS